MGITFAVLGRDESELLANAVGQAIEAAGPGDEVLFVDSASADGSAARAAGLGVQVVEAPAGKGSAVARALEEASGEHVVLLDADIERTSTNFAAALRDEVERTGADLVVGAFDEPRVPRRLVSELIWPRLVPELFPEAHIDFGRTLLSGFRAVRRTFPLGRLPEDFAVEAHVNLAVASGGGSVATAELGSYWGPVRTKEWLGLQVGAAILDLAEERGGLEPALREHWDDWVRNVVDLIAEGWELFLAGRLGDTDAVEELASRLGAAAAAELPPRRAAA
jgi:glucosyl-3-phosphoglycerate synthase